MAVETYTYSITDDTPNGRVSPRNLDQEIRANFNITRELAGITIIGDDLKVDFLAPLDVPEEAALDAVVGAHVGEVTVKAPVKTTATGVPFVMPEWREGNPTDFISFNWCNKSTWFESSVQTTNEILTTSDDVVFDSANTSWICVTHGMLPQEHRLLSYQHTITVDDEVAQDCSTDSYFAWKASGNPTDMDGDYCVDYDTGKVTFKTAQTGKTVKASYYYATTADFFVEPNEGTVLRLTAVEVQFSSDTVLTDSVCFSIEGFVEAFAPGMVDNDNPNYVTTFPSGTRIPLGAPRIYQTMYDYIAEAQRAYPLIPKLGGDSWRGMDAPVYVMRWPYQEDATRDLSASKGMRIKISLLKNTDFGGSMATATLYAVSINED